MCGIAGALSFTSSSFAVTEPYVVSLRDTMCHRGPDGAGVWLSDDGRVGFGFRRLAIIDLSPAADQPMCNEDGTLWLVFNGEIYNHAEVRTELERIGGHRWKTDHSDSEVILHAFEQWGISCLERFRGMFAIALWDAKQRELWLIRDRVGIKPLYYSIHHERIVFASEIKALLEDPEQQRKVSEEGLFHFLSFLTVPAPHTLFEGINKLPAGTWMRVRADGSVQEHRYWDVLDHVRALDDVSEGVVAKRVLSELRDAVKLRKVSDVPVGVFLSGGIDSSANAALFSEGEAGTVKTFSIGYDDDYGSYRNELEYAKAVAAEVGAEYHEKLLSADDLIEFLPRMVYLQDEPIADPVCIPVYYVAKLARENGVIVCQVGEGADELFCGYPRWRTMLRLQRLDDLPVPTVFKALTVKLLSMVGMDNDWRYEYLRRGSANVPIFWGGAEGFTHAQKMRLLSPRLRERLKGMTSWDVLAPIRRRFEEKSASGSALDWMTYLDLNLRLPELLLMRVDKMTMGVSLEARVPFLDHKFVEYAMSIPADMKIRGGNLKHILKAAVRGVIPDRIIDRQKQGFGAPIDEWFEDRLGVVTRNELRDFCDATDLLDWKEVERVLNSGSPAKTWPLLNLAKWWNANFRREAVG
jgi:asparagine synthase (glutamine-hydrolysing)